MESTDYEKDVLAYKDRMKQYRQQGLEAHTNKHFIVLNALEGVVNEEALTFHLRRIRNKDGDADFSLISIIRMLFLLEEKLQELDGHSSSSDGNINVTAESTASTASSSDPSSHAAKINVYKRLIREIAGHDRLRRLLLATHWETVS